MPGIPGQCNCHSQYKIDDEHVVVSSPGAFGWYPWIDVDNGYYGVIAVQERYRLFNNPSEKSVEFGISLRPLIEAALDQ